MNVPTVAPPSRDQPVGAPDAAPFAPVTLREVLGCVYQAVGAVSGCVRVHRTGPLRVVEAGSIQQAREYAARAFPAAAMIGGPIRHGSVVKKVRVTFDTAPQPPASIPTQTEPGLGEGALAGTRGEVNVAVRLVSAQDDLVLEVSQQPGSRSEPPHPGEFRALLERARRTRVEDLPNDAVIAPPQIPARFRREPVTT